MVITRQGAGYLKLQSGKTTVLVDPTDERSFKGAQLALFTRDGGEPTGLKEESQIFVIRHAGEYEVGGIRVRGLQVPSEGDEERTIYTVRFDDIRFALFGDTPVLPKEEMQEYLQDMDVAAVPGGKETAAEVAGMLRQLTPSVIIPLYTEDVKPFLKEFGADACPAEDKFVFKKSDLEKGSMQLRCLT